MTIAGLTYNVQSTRQPFCWSTTIPIYQIEGFFVNALNGKQGTNLFLRINNEFNVLRKMYQEL